MDIVEWLWTISVSILLAGSAGIGWLVWKDTKGSKGKE